MALCLLEYLQYSVSSLSVFCLVQRITRGNIRVKCLEINKNWNRLPTNRLPIYLFKSDPFNFLKLNIKFRDEWQNLGRRNVILSASARIQEQFWISISLNFSQDTPSLSSQNHTVKMKWINLLYLHDRMKSRANRRALSLMRDEINDSNNN